MFLFFDFSVLTNGTILVPVCPRSIVHTWDLVLQTICQVPHTIVPCPHTPKPYCCCTLVCPIFVQKPLGLSKWNCKHGYKVCNSITIGPWRPWWGMVTMFFYSIRCAIKGKWKIDELKLCQLIVVSHKFSHAYHIFTFWKLGFVIEIGYMLCTKLEQRVFNLENRLKYVLKQ